MTGRRSRTCSSASSDVVKHFPVESTGCFRARTGPVHAVDGVSLEIRRGETLGLVGETGCGKSTLGPLHHPAPRPHRRDASSFDGHDISHAVARAAAPVPPRDADDLPGPVRLAEPAPPRRLDHRRPVRDPRHRRAAPTASAQVQELMELVGLNPEHYNRFPAEFSGGQRQRIGVARALALRPKLIVCDEPVSALDVSIQAQIINLLADLQERARAHLRLHRARPVGRAPRQRPDRGDVPRQDRRARRRPRISSSSRATRTRRRCSRRSPSSTTTATTRRSGSCWPATCRRRSTRRRAAGSIHAARRRATAARVEEPAQEVEAGDRRRALASRATSRSAGRARRRRGSGAMSGDPRRAGGPRRSVAAIRAAAARRSRAAARGGSRGRGCAATGSRSSAAS